MTTNRNSTRNRKVRALTIGLLLVFGTVAAVSIVAPSAIAHQQDCSQDGLVNINLGCTQGDHNTSDDDDEEDEGGD